jgi:ion channel-forming bestrophin family protein
MHAGRHYSIKEVLYWTRRDIYWLVAIACIPTILYEILNCKWMTLPWVPIALVGTAVAFLVGFKNNATYDRMWEARRSWGSIINSSRAWGIFVKDYITARHSTAQVTDAQLRGIHRQLIYRHFAWLAAMRYQLREPRVWENMNKSYNKEYRAHNFRVAEQEGSLADELKKYLSPEELEYVMTKKNKATQILSLQSKQLRELLDNGGLIEDFRHMELGKVLAEFYNQQGVCERIKNFPYPRQFATANMYFIKLFIVMLPFGMLQEFQKMGENFVWLTVPFSALVSWVFTTMEKIGESTENPFEGSANDIPMTAMSRTIEIDLREMLDETEIPPAIQPVHNILL